MIKDETLPGSEGHHQEPDHQAQVYHVDEVDENDVMGEGGIAQEVFNQSQPQGNDSSNETGSKNPPEKINKIQDIYRYIYFRGLNHSKAIELILQETPPSHERDEIVNFIQSSERGIMKGFAV